MTRFPDSRLLSFARRLQSAQTFDVLLEELGSEIREAIGYESSWVCVLVPEANAFKVLSAQGPALEDVWQLTPLIPVEGDAYISEIVETGEARVIEDAQIDPRVNREIVEQLGNRTVINVPMTMIEDPFGTLGCGTFGDEGVRLPTEEEMVYLHELAHHVVVASARILLDIKREESMRQAAEMEMILARRQRLESLGELAGGVAHDFNNLLTVIRASAQLLRTQIDNPEQSDGLRMIEDAAQSAGELTARLLALGKRQQLQMRPLDVKERVDAVTSMLSRVIPADIELVVSAAPDLPVVLGDASQIEQVLMNLCINARDAMPGGGHLSIDVEPFEITEAFVREQPWAKTGHYVLVTVTDDGHGMPPQTLERIFEPFFTTKAERHGTGLGLPVSRGIVEQHGGLLHAYSDAGIGTSMRMYLPLAGDVSAPVRDDPSEEVRGGSERILVADDQEHVRAVIDRVLTRAGYTVTAVGDGAEAIAVASSERFDMVVLDAVMPEVGGREAYERIHEMHPAVPVLFVSGYGGEELTTRILRDLDVPLLAKPFDPEALLRIVRRSLDEAAARS